jgi:ABC-type multidrug transport system fused ATPase/permease subunit
MLALSALLLAAIALELLTPQVIRFFLDTAQSGGPQTALLGAAGLFIAIALLQRGAAVGGNYLAKLIGWAATNALRADLARHVLQLDLAFHKQHTPGELIERIDGDVTALANFFSAFVVQVAGNGLLVVGILLLLFRENPLVGAGLTVYTIATLLVLRAIQPLAVARWTRERAVSAELYGFIEERISGAEEIRAAGAEAHTLRRLYGLLRRSLEAFRASIMADTLIYNVTSLLSVIGYTAGLALGALLYLRGEATLGAAYLIVAYVGMLAGPLQRIRAELQDLQQATASLNRIHELLQMQPRTGEIADRDARGISRSGLEALAGLLGLHKQPAKASSSDDDALPDGADIRETLPRGPLSVAFADVSFAYRDEAPPAGEHETDEPAAGPPIILQEINFRVAPGRVLGVLGRTGSGKTTLTRLLVRFYDPDAGVISVGGADLHTVPLRELRCRVTLVTQDVQLFRATLRDNLTFFDPAVGDDQIERALRELGLWDWARSLPQGLDTPLAAGGDGAAGISAGEAQLVAFARAFLKDPGLVILDEASSRLDPATEARLEGAIDRLFRNRTGIVIAHRLRTVQRADDILILEADRVVEYGPRERLAADPASRFSHLLRTGLEEALA